MKKVAICYKGIFAGKRISNYLNGSVHMFMRILSLGTICLVFFVERSFYG
jgi:hypothetical protein